MSEQKNDTNQKKKPTPKAPEKIWVKIWKMLKTRTLWAVLVALVVVVVVLVIYINFSLKDQPISKTTISTVLQEALDIDELSVSSFIYNGIADVYDPSTRKVSYSVLYHATVKAGISLSGVLFDVDEENQVIHVQLPEISIQDVVVDPAYIDFIPDRAEIHMATALATCRSDALQEAKESDLLINAARDNLKSVIEALTQPVIADTGYTIEW